MRGVEGEEEMKGMELKEVTYENYVGEEDNGNVFLGRERIESNRGGKTYIITR